jgi:MFS family permease
MVGSLEAGGEKMTLVVPNILEEARQLSPSLLAAGLILGLLLWLYGGRGHRFWLVLTMTTAGGVFGLSFGAAYSLQPLVAGLLLAVTAGALALALARVILFIAGGAACIWLARTIAPSWDEPALCFLLGGLLGVLLYKVWVTALSSLAGALLIAYSILGLFSHLGMDGLPTWADQQAPLLNWICAATAVLGLLTQLLMERRRLRRIRKKATDEIEAEQFARDHPPPPPLRRPWWDLRPLKMGGKRAA